MDDPINPGNLTPAVPSERVQLREYWHVILERRWLIIATFALCVILGFFYAYRTVPVYEAVARIQIDPEASGALNLRDVVNIQNKDQDYLQTMYRNLQSRSLIESVMVHLKLDENERYSALVDKVAGVLADFRVEPIRLTRLFEIHARHTDPKIARDMANRLVEEFRSVNQTRKSYKAMAGYRLLVQEAQIQEQNLEQAIRDLHNYRVEKGMISLEETSNVILKRLAVAQQDYELASVNAVSVQKIADEAKRWRDDGKDLADFGEIANDQFVKELKVAIARENSQLSSLRTRYRDKHPQVVSILSSLKTDKIRKAPIKRERL